MTTDQIQTIDTYVDDVAASDDLVTHAEEEARQIVAKARYEAFRMMTDARVEAEAILDEARPVHQLGGESEDEPIDYAAALAAAEAEAAAIIEEARTTAQKLAGDIVDQASAQASQIAEEARATLESERADLLAEYEDLEQKVEGTRSILERLEARLAAIAMTPPASQPNQPAPQVHAEPTAPVSVSRPNMIAPGRKAMWAAPENIEGAPLAAPKAETEVVEAPAPSEGPSRTVILDYSPSVEPVKRTETEVAPEEEPAERGSYYSRRSAKLPRIGESAGQDAIGAAKSFRKAIEQ